LIEEFSVKNMLDTCHYKPFNSGRIMKSPKCGLDLLWVLW